MGSLWEFLKDSIEKSKNPTLSMVAVLLIVFVLGELYSLVITQVEFWYPWWVLVAVLVIMVLNEVLNKPTPKS